jgi:hypothetical protein
LPLNYRVLLVLGSKIPKANLILKICATRYSLRKFPIILAFFERDDLYKDVPINRVVGLLFVEGV